LWDRDLILSPPLAHLRACAHTNADTHARTHIYTRVRMHINFLLTHAHKHTHTHACTHTHIHTHTHTHTRTHTHTHTQTLAQKAQTPKLKAPADPQVEAFLERCSKVAHQQGTAVCAHAPSSARLKQVISQMYVCVHEV